MAEHARRAGYDYIIVGAGSAGCVLANRLSADPAISVLLLEAGSRDLDPLIHIPLGMGKIHQHRLHDWGYDTEPEPGCEGRRIKIMRGKTLGGSSAINIMAYTRGHPGDFDRWARGGAKGWSFAECLPYFKRSESWEGGGDHHRGSDGPIGTQWATTKDPLFDALLEAARQAQLPMTDDYNGARPVGWGRGQFTIKNGKRCSSAVAHLRPAANRPNLTIKTRAHTTRILFEGPRATGIEYVIGGEVMQAAAAREVILSAGAYNTPQLLMLSGIGPAAHLKEIGIDVRADLPVGQNLQDHMAPLMMWSRPQNTSSFRDALRFDRMAFAMVQAYLLGSGPGTVIPGGLHAFMTTEPGLDVPDLEFMFRGAPPVADLWFPGIKRKYDDAFGIRPCVLHPKSRGWVKLKSSDPFAPPRIQGNYLTEPYDIEIIRRGFKIARDVVSRPPVAPYHGTETAPGPNAKTDAEIDLWIRQASFTVDHPACTAKMGVGEDAVVDPELKVRGFERLRVVDASVMPDLTSAHLNACVLMMGEKASDMILGKPLLKPIPAKDAAMA